MTQTVVLNVLQLQYQSVGQSKQYPDFLAILRALPVVLRVALEERSWGHLNLKGFIIWRGTKIQTKYPKNLAFRDIVVMEVQLYLCLNSEHLMGYFKHRKICFACTSYIL